MWGESGNLGDDGCGEGERENGVVGGGRYGRVIVVLEEFHGSGISILCIFGLQLLSGLSQHAHSAPDMLHAVCTFNGSA